VSGFIDKVTFVEGKEVKQEAKNQAEAAGWKRSVEAFDGSGSEFAQYVLYQKIAGAYRNIMVNTADSPIMRIFESFNGPAGRSKAMVPPAARSVLRSSGSIAHRAVERG
jgi:hypothetical protein